MYVLQSLLKSQQGHSDIPGKRDERHQSRTAAGFLHIWLHYNFIILFVCIKIHENKLNTEDGSRLAAESSEIN